jgi:hypothetical protein
LTRIGIQKPKSLRHLSRSFVRLFGVLPHLPPAVTAHPVRIDGQNFATKISIGSADFSQGDLECLGILYRVLSQKVMNRRIAGHKRKTASQFETASISQRPVGP